MPATGEQFKRFYPGLIPIEQDLWRAWLIEHEGEYDFFEYNVRVGQGVNIAPRMLEGDPELQERIRRQFQEATQKKIDCIGHRGASLTIFEVEERPGTRALGQLLTYRRLLEDVRPPIAPWELAIVAERLGNDMREVFTAQGVAIFLVSPAPR